MCRRACASLKERFDLLLQCTKDGSPQKLEQTEENPLQNGKEAEFAPFCLILGHFIA